MDDSPILDMDACNNDTIDGDMESESSADDFLPGTSYDDLINIDGNADTDDDSNNENQQGSSDDDISHDDDDDDDDSSSDGDGDVARSHDSTILHWLMIVFFRIISHFNISKNAASAILSFISLFIGMCPKHL